MNSITQDPIAKTLYRLTWPMIFGVLAIIAVDLADTFFLGHYGHNELAAISFCFPVMFTVISMVLGLGSGTASVLSRALGAKDMATARQYTRHGLFFSLILSIILALSGYLTIEPLFSAIGATDPVLPLIKTYMSWWYLSFPLVVIPIMTNSLWRAAGNTKLPAAVMGIGAVINIILNPIFIFGLDFSGISIPEMGIYGAGLSTSIARLIMAIVCVWQFFRKTELLQIQRTFFRHVNISFRKIFHVAIPAAASSMINPFIATLITAIVARYGIDAVASYGVANQIANFALVPLLALSGTIGAFTGQNWGAENYLRVKTGLRYAFAFCVLWALFCGGFFLVFAGDISAQFTDNPDVIALAKDQLNLIMITSFGYGIVIVGAGALNAIGKPLSGMFASIIRTVAIFYPAALILSDFFGLYGVFYANMLANILGGIIAVVLTFRSIR